MERTAVHQLLGVPYFTASVECQPGEGNLFKLSDPLTHNCDWYLIAHPTDGGCGNASKTYLELSHKSGRVIAFRITSRRPEDYPYHYFYGIERF